MFEGRSLVDETDSQYGTVLARLRGAKTDMCETEQFFHVCASSVCNPQSEPDLVSRNQLMGPPLSNNVYMCRYGVVHLCTESACGLYMSSRTLTCPISGVQYGMVYSSYDKHDNRTWPGLSEPQPPPPPPQPPTMTQVTKKRKKKHSRVMSDEDANFQASELVIRLLYSTYRAHVNNVAKESYAVQARKGVQTYVMQRAKKHQLPFFTDLVRVSGHILSQPLPLKEFEYDSARITYYAAIVVHIWKLVVKYTVPVIKNDVSVQPRIDFESVCLGTLYGMKQGVAENGHIILPSDYFLAENLPKATDLSYFNIERSKINDGAKLILEMNQTCKSVDEKKLSVHILPGVLV